VGATLFMMTKVWEKVTEGGAIQSVRIFEDRSQIHQVRRESGNKITGRGGFCFIGNG
jgi:hypothetical protein